MKCGTLDLLDLDHTIAKSYLSRFQNPWEALPGLKEFILELGKSLPKEYEKAGEGVWIHKTCSVFETAFINGPCIVGENTEIRQCAFIRGSALIGKDCVVGNSTEVKNAILFDHVQVPHYDYVGDSILGYHSHMGAGCVTSNVKNDRSLVKIHNGGEDIETGLKKMGAIIGDFVEVGCNSVLNPGSVIGRNSSIYPLSLIRGTVKENSICKTGGVIVEKRQ